MAVVELFKSMLVGNQYIEAGYEVEVDDDKAQRLEKAGVAQIISEHHHVVHPMPDITQWDGDFKEWPFQNFDEYVVKLQHIKAAYEKTSTEVEQLKSQIRTLNGNKS